MHQRFQEGLNIIKISYKLFFLFLVFLEKARFHDETERVHSFIGSFFMAIKMADSHAAFFYKISFYCTVVQCFFLFLGFLRFSGELG